MDKDPTHQLAAIMFADMVGYTALMQEDEERARLLRDRHRAVAAQLVPKYLGKVLQHYGDGTLSVFGSAVKAVECAVEIQRELKRGPSVSVRMGVHTGNIVQDADGVFGEGVNVAARIQALAPPGGILVSAKVFDEIKNHTTLSAALVGMVPLKHLKGSVEVYAIVNEGLAVLGAEEVLALARLQGGPELMGTTGLEPSGPEEQPVDARGLGEKFLLAVKERAMIQWGLVYLAGAWVVLQIAGFAVEALRWPSIVHQALGLLSFVGFFVALVVTWFHGKRGRQRIRKTEVLLIGALLAVAGLALSKQGFGDSEGVPGTGSPGARVGESRPGIAVLPFENFSPNPDDAYFANGLQEDITSALSQIRTLRVPGRSSVERFRDDRPSAREMARILGADYLLEGSARIVSGTVKVTVQLIDGRTDEHIWAQEFDRPFSVEEVIQIQSETAQAVASQLRAITTPEEDARIASLPTRSPEAFELLHRARYRWNMRTEEDVRESLRLLLQAVSRDPDYAAAHVAVADAFLVLANWGWEDHRVAFPAAVAAAERAVALDPEMANAHASLGGVHLWCTRNWERAEAEFLRALELDSENSYAHFWYSALLSALDRHDEAVAHARDAVALDPLSPPVASALPRALFMKRDYGEAVREARKALGLHPDFANLHSLLCSSLIGEGDYLAAEAACRRHQEAMGVAHSLNMAILRAYEGDREAAYTEVEAAASNTDAEGGQPVIEAMVFAGLGETEAAMNLLLKAEVEEFPHMEYLSTHPFFDNLRGDPGFQALLGRLGLEEASAFRGDPGR